MKIAFFELEKWEEDYIKEKLKMRDLYFYKEPLTVKNKDKINGVDIAVCFIYSELKSNVLENSPVKFITTMSTGFDHIDLKYCKEKGIKVSNVPSYGENTVAEHAFGLILTLSRKLDKAINQTKHDDFSLKGLMGFDLKGKTLGVVGAGHIGQHVIKMAKGFDMNVIAYSASQDKKLSKDLGFEWASFNDLLKKSDIITFHVPLTPETRHMINMGNIKKIKRGAYLINTARGEIIDTQALLYALDNDILAGAGLDVLEGEENIREEKALLSRKKDERDWKTFLQNHMLLKDKDVIITPHCAFDTKEALQRILDTTIENIKSFTKGSVMNSVY